MTQEELLDVFRPLRAVIKKYEGPLVARLDLESRYDLWSEKPMIVLGKARKEMFFAGAIVQNSYVGFYYMPVVTDAEAAAFFPPELLRLRKGKSCFHLKKWTPELEQQIAAVLEKGYKLYQGNGWI